MAQEQDIKSAQISYPIWRTTWSLKLETQAELFTLLHSSWNYITTNLCKFTCGYGQGKILKVYDNTTSVTEYETTNIASCLVIYSSINCMLDYGLIRHYMQKQSPEFNFQANLFMKPTIVKQINTPDWFTEIIQTNPNDIILTDLKAIAEHEKLLRPVAQLE